MVDDKITMIPCGEFEGCNSYIQQIKMPMFLTNRSIPVLYYFKENPVDNSIEYISSSRDTDGLVA